MKNQTTNHLKNIFQSALVVLIILMSENLKAQDIHWSQFFVNPFLTNPANSGFFNGDYRLTGIYRSQWGSVTVPYKTFAGTGDFRFVKGNHSRDLFGVGMMATSDKAGDSQFSTTQFGLDLAYNKCLDHFGNQYFGGGILATYGASTIDYSNLTFDEQWGNNNPPTENVSLNSLSYMDVSVGATWNWVPDHHNNFGIGAALYHANNPQRSFTGVADSKLEPKFVITGNGQYKFHSRIEAFPKLIYEKQGPYQELDLGSFARINLDRSRESHYGVYVGSWYRVKDALIFVSRFDIQNLSIGFSYDVNLSKLTKISAAQGGPEISFIYIGDLPGFHSKEVFCPRF